MKRALNILKGLLYGYAAYLPVMFAVERLSYGRIDSEKAFYALYYPFGAPFLVVPSNWKYADTDEIILNIVGGALLIAGVALSLWMRKRAPQ